MKILSALLLASTLLLVSCNGGGVGDISASDQRAIDARAVGNVGCVIEDQQLCSQLINQRSIIAQYFSPVETRNVTGRKKKVGKRSVTKRIVDAAASIRQCNKSDADAIALIQNMEIANSQYSLQATSPVTSTSDCFLIGLEG